MKRGVIFLILLMGIFSFIISAEDVQNATSSDATASVIAKCYTDSDCSRPANWCKDSQLACKPIVRCLNPGQANAECSHTEDCVDCINLGYVGCKEGQCISASSPSSVRCSKDEDCGQSSISKYCRESSACIDEKIIFCQNPGTTESFCNTKSSQSGGNCNPCQYGCQNGECLSQPVSNYCTDPDGTDHFTAGKTCSNFGCEVDKCEGNTIIEYACRDGRALVDHTYGCINGCQNGACISETTIKPTNCVQRGGTCCKADVCGTPSVCEQGYFAVLKGCNSDCKPIVDCQKIAQEEVKEQVECIFVNSKTEQRCYLSGDNYKFTCPGVESCVMDVNGYKGQQLTWKSTCGGYAYTTVDGENDPISFECRFVESPVATATPVQIPGEIQPYTMTWYSVAHWECYDKTRDKQGDSCKPPEVWKKYAEEFCRNHCDKETGKCGVNSFGVYAECSGATIVKPSVCGNDLCESGEGEICEIKDFMCSANKVCQVPIGKCSIACPQDCKKPEEIGRAKIGGTFNLGMSQEVAFDYLPSDSQGLKIKFNDLFVPRCVEDADALRNQETEKPRLAATIEKYDTMTGDVISGFVSESVAVSEESSIPSIDIASSTSGRSSSEASSKCLNTEPYAVLQIKFSEDGKEKTEVIKLQLGEKKKVFDFLISFLDYWPEKKGGSFLVSLSESENFVCPENCICDLSGKTKECKRIERCEEGKMLCSDGTCQKQCEITEITTECKFGCFYQDKCLPYGLRVNGLYCSISNDMKTQLGGEGSCDNNFECSSNVCVSGKCVSSGLMNKILGWFKKLFGEEKSEVIDCGTSTECLGDAFKTCQPAKLSNPNGASSEIVGAISEIAIIGLEDKKCIMKWTAKIEGSEESMKCKFENYTLGIKDIPSGSLEQYCEGGLVYWLSSPSKMGTAPVLNSAVVATKLSADSNDLRYSFTINDPDGIEEFRITKSDFGEVSVKAVPSCAKDFITEFEFKPSDLPLKASVEDCSEHAARQELDLDIQIPTA